MRLSRELSFREIAKYLCVSTGTVLYIWNKFEGTGDVYAKKQPPRVAL